MEPISFELNGFPKTLRNENACRKAIEKKQITAETPILAYDGGGVRQRILAKDHLVLRDLLGIEDDLTVVVEGDEGAGFDTISIPESPSKAATSDEEEERKEAAVVAESDATRDRATPDYATLAETNYTEESVAAANAAAEDGQQSVDEPPKSKLGWLVPAIGLVLVLIYNANSDDEPAEAAFDNSFGNQEATEQYSEADPSLDQTYNGDFGLIRPTQILSEPGTNSIKTLRAGAKFFVRGTRQKYAYGYDESNTYGYVAWSDINANPFDSRTYQFTFGNSTRERVYLLVTFKVGNEWKQRKITIPPNYYNQVLRLDGQVAQIGSLEGYYYRVKTASRWNRLRATSERVVFDPGAKETDAKMTMIVPRVENTNAYIEF